MQSPHLPQSGVHWHPLRAPPGGGAASGSGQQPTVTAQGEEIRELKAQMLQLTAQMTEYRAGARSGRAEAPAGPEATGLDRLGDGETALQKRLNALEEQVVELRHVYIDELGDVRAQITDLRDMVGKLQSGERGERADVEDEPASASPALVPAVQKKQLWSDIQDEPEGEHTESESAAHSADAGDGAVQRTGATNLDAAKQLEKMLQHLRDHEEEILNGSGDTKRHLDFVKDRTQEALLLLGYRVVVDNEHGDMDVDNADVEEGMTASGEQTAEVLDAQRGGDNDDTADLAEDAVMDVSAPPPCGTGERAECSEEQSPGAYVSSASVSVQQSATPAYSHDDTLEQIIKCAQVAHARDMQEVGWPLPLPSGWYWSDPKRAGRCLARAGLGRDPTTQDLSFRTETRRVRENGAISAQHRSVVHFSQWGHTFVGDTKASVSEAERAAFRAALDAYSDWIDWTHESRVISKAVQATRVSRPART